MKIFHLTSPGPGCGVWQYTRHLVEALEAFSVEQRFVEAGEEFLGLFRSEKPDILHIQFASGTYHDGTLRNLVRQAQPLGVPIVVTVHNHVEAALTLNAHALLVHSREDEERVRSAGSLVLRIPQGVTQAIDYSPPDRRSFFAMHGFRLPHKGVMVALSAWERFVPWALDRYLEPRLIVSMPSHPPNTRQSQQVLEQMDFWWKLFPDLAKTTEFHVDFADHETLVQRLSRASVFLYPYLSGANQSSSAALSTAISLARPAIVSDLPVFGEDRRGVLAVPPSDSAALCEAMQQVLPQETYERLEREMKSRREEAGWDRIAGEVKSVYDRVREASLWSVGARVTGSSFVGSPILPTPVRAPEGVSGRQRILLSGGGAVPYSFSMVLASWARELWRQGCLVEVERLHPTHMKGLLGMTTSLGESVDVQIQFEFPPRFVFRQGVRKRVGVLCWETTYAPEDWKELSSTLDLILVPSVFSRNALEASGVDGVRIREVPLGMDHLVYQPSGRKMDWREHGFSNEETAVFFHMGQFDTRKGTDLVFEAYRRAFRREENVLLALKHGPSTSYLRRYLGEKASVSAATVLIEGEKSSLEIAAMMRNVDLGVFPYRAEGGFGLVPLEMMACGRPIFHSRFGAPMEYSEGLFVSGRLVPSTFSSAHHQEHPKAEWFEPNLSDLSAGMRAIAEVKWGSQEPEVRAMRELLQDLGEKGPRIARSYTWERSAYELRQVLG